MKIIVFGANGKTGRIVIEKALQAGHEVSAFVRDQSKLQIEQPGLTIIEGQATVLADVEQAVAGHELVISCLGSDKGMGKSTILHEMTKNIVAAMKKQDVNRIIYMASAGVDKEIPGLTGKMVMKMLANPLADHRNAIAEIKAGGLTYTIARPMGLTDKPETGQYREAMTGIPDKGRSISRADVADFIVKTIGNSQYENKSVALSD
ncbi:SDR family oxidoreductase [Bacillus sp. AGMB 02131]|uniref:SDR family oxidoreductase n=1 Tax=Peribacillus faecalis TaxID=2772559 RepID=A0A927HA41_9BACI|nr:NAD(P)-binding oxidoreductase [Peribacillus faecalis]MBD3107152.1 SDR family oxidoreductase [Peribacillus faecalis]